MEVNYIEIIISATQKTWGGPLQLLSTYPIRELYSSNVLVVPKREMDLRIEEI